MFNTPEDEKKAATGRSQPSEDELLQSLAGGSSASDPTAETLTSGTILNGRYEIQTLVGQGGECLVYKAFHKLMKRAVSVKILRKRFLSDPTRVKRFAQEAESSSRLSHPNIGAVYDFGLSELGRPYLVMEYIEGQTLLQILDRKVCLEPEYFREVFIQICNGLGHAHAQRLIHRDLKPSNVMVMRTTDGEEIVKLLDFGMAMILPTEKDQSERLTQAGEFVGTSYYMSPEQCRGRQVDPRSDVYALGCVMYESLAGLPPFMGQDMLDTMQMHLADPPLPFSEVREDLNCPPALEAIVMKALQKNPDDRFQSVREVKEALLSFNSAGTGADVSSSDGVEQRAPEHVSVATAEPEAAARSNQTESVSKSSRAMIGAALCAVAIAAAGLGFWIRQQQPAGKPENPTVPAVLSEPAKSPPGDKSTEIDKQEINRLARLARVCHKKGQCDVAEKLLKQSVALSSKVYGGDSHETIGRLDELATFYAGMGQSDKAEVILEQIMDIRSRSGKKESAP